MIPSHYYNKSGFIWSVTVLHWHKYQDGLKITTINNLGCRYVHLLQYSL